MKKLTILNSLFTIALSSAIFTVEPESLIGIQQREQAEQAFKETYKHLDIPNIVPGIQNAYHHCNPHEHHDFIDRHYDFFAHPLGQIAQECFIKPFFTYEPTITKEYETDHFILLHEIGHYELSKTLPTQNIAPISLTTGITAMMLCGKHKKLPYKNIITKAISKSIAGLSAAGLSYVSLARFHEVYADNYACQHIQDKEKLQQAISDLKKMDKEFKSFYQESSGPATLIGYNFFRFYHDPVHPSSLSRAQKAERMLHKRFSV